MNLKIKSVLASVLGTALLLTNGIGTALATSVKIDRFELDYGGRFDRDSIKFEMPDLTPIPFTFEPNKSSGKITISYIHPETGEKRLLKDVTWAPGDFKRVGERSVLWDFFEVDPITHTARSTVTFAVFREPLGADEKKVELRFDSWIPSLPIIDTESCAVEFVVDIEIRPEESAEVKSMTGSIFGFQRGEDRTEEKWISEIPLLPICPSFR